MTTAAEQAGVSAAEDWLAVVDAADYERSWELTASNFKAGVCEPDFFKSGISKREWRSALSTVRDSLGKALLRRLKSKRLTAQLDWEPPADYIVLEYETTFERQTVRTEIVILMKESDGEWRVSGYRFRLDTSNQMLR